MKVGVIGAGGIGGFYGGVLARGDTPIHDTAAVSLAQGVGGSPFCGGLPNVDCVNRHPIVRPNSIRQFRLKIVRRTLAGTLLVNGVIGCAGVLRRDHLAPMTSYAAGDSVAATPGVHVPDRLLFWVIIVGAFVVFYLISHRSDT